MATAAVPPSFPSLEAEAAFWRERAAVAEAAARDAREELEEFQVRGKGVFLARGPGGLHLEIFRWQFPISVQMRLSG